MKEKQFPAVDSKSNELIKILKAVFKKDMNLARIKFISLFICALCKVRSVCFEKCACAFDNDCSTVSSLRRIQRFMADYLLKTDIIAKIIFSMLPHDPPYRLAIDRTNWKFGKTNINILTLAVIYKGVAFPILFTMLDKQGSSNTPERISLILRFCKLFGQHTIDCLLADREFVGEQWIEFLNRNAIRYYIRIRENFYVNKPGTGEQIKAGVLFANLKFNQHRDLYKIYRVNGQDCYLSASKIKNKDGKPELQIIISYNKPENAIETYKERWQIETAFRGLKSSGFNIEDTHLTDVVRIEKLFSIVMLAFAWCYIIGIYLCQNIKPIRMANGKKVKSFFRYGLDFINNSLLYDNNQSIINIFKFLSCT